MKLHISFTCLSLLLTISLMGQSHFQKSLQAQMIMVEDGGTIELPEGHYQLTSSIWLDGKNDVIIKGAGIDKTFLSFKDQTQGAEGVKVTNAKNITLKGFTVQDSKGDAIKTQDVDGISFLDVRTEWTGKPNKKNGAYGLYPVQCQNVLIDRCEAIGASDAGIYVGQSDHVIVRNSRAYRNVAGIEIENTTNADVYNCVAEGNTGGILIFDLPGLIKKKGGNVRVYRNTVRSNNYKNFAPKGNIVGTVPPGSGIIVLATSDVEIYDNKVEGNKTIGVSVSSYYITETPFDDLEYNPYCSNVYIHDNEFSKRKRFPTLSKRLGILLFMKFKRNVPDILIDGIFDEKQLDTEGNLKPEYRICLSNNLGATFGYLDAANDFENLHEDPTSFTCEGKTLPSLKLVAE